MGRCSHCLLISSKWNMDVCSCAYDWVREIENYDKGWLMAMNAQGTHAHTYSAALVFRCMYAWIHVYIFTKPYKVQTSLILLYLTMHMCDVWLQSTFLSFIQKKKSIVMQSYLFSRHLPFAVCVSVSPSSFDVLWGTMRQEREKTNTKCISFSISLAVFSVFTHSSVFFFLFSFRNCWTVCSMRWMYCPNQQWRWRWRQWSSNNVMNLPNRIFILTRIELRIHTHTQTAVSRSSWFLVQPLL